MATDGTLLTLTTRHALCIAPLERLQIPASLSGRHGGTNRAPDAWRRIAAQDDLGAVLEWLGSHAARPSTQLSYRKQAERLLLWALIEQRKPLSSLDHEDLALYRRFLEDPQPSWRWLTHSGSRHRRQSLQWRPFSGPLSDGSITHAFKSLHAMFLWLVQGGYLLHNPVLAELDNTSVVRSFMNQYLTRAWREAILQRIDALPNQTGKAQRRAARYRWLFALLCYTELPTSALHQITMRAFTCKVDALGQSSWWLNVGIEQPTKVVPAAPALIDELCRYRLAYGLSAHPDAHDTRPIILPLSGRGEPMAYSAVQSEVHQLLMLAEACRDRPANDDQARVERLRQRT